MNSSDVDVKGIQEGIARRDLLSLKEIMEGRSAPDIADLLLELKEADRFVFFRLIPRDLASEVFAFLEPRYRDEIIHSLSVEETRRLLADLRPDDRIELFEELPGQAVQRLLNLLSPEDLAEARQLLGYPPESVGRLMTPDYVAVRPSWTVERALRHIRSRGRVSETINDIYVTDPNWELLDALELRKFILAEPDQTVEDLMDYGFVSIPVTADREQAVQLIQRYDLDSLPVVDSRGILLGIVTVDDVMDVAEEETTEDFHKTAAVTPLRISYRDSSVAGLYAKRIPWLLGLVFLSLISSGILAAYEKTLSSVIVLAFFIPLLIDSGGNVGSQSATIIIRSLATGDVRLGQWFRTAAKEIGVGISLGVTMGAATSLVGFYRGGWEIGLVVGITMTVIVIVSNIVGASLPFVLTRLRLDPAAASSPLITTIVDIMGLILYFFVATVLLRAFNVL
jgi:magnesium transporter